MVTADRALAHSKATRRVAGRALKLAQEAKAEALGTGPAGGKRAAKGSNRSGPRQPTQALSPRWGQRRYVLDVVDRQNPNARVQRQAWGTDGPDAAAQYALASPGRQVVGWSRARKDPRRIKLEQAWWKLRRTPAYRAARKRVRRRWAAIPAVRRARQARRVASALASAMLTASRVAWRAAKVAAKVTRRAVLGSWKLLTAPSKLITMPAKLISSALVLLLLVWLLPHYWPGIREHAGPLSRVLPSSTSCGVPPAEPVGGVRGVAYEVGHQGSRVRGATPTPEHIQQGIRAVGRGVGQTWVTFRDALNGGPAPAQQLTPAQQVGGCCPTTGTFGATPVPVGLTTTAAPVAGGVAGTVAAARLAGFTGDDLVTAVAVSLAEDTAQDPNATHLNTNGTTDHGLWQINSVHADLLASGDWRSPVDNARMAHGVFTQQGWQAWTTWTSGAYRDHLPQARQAVGQGAATPVAQGASVRPASLTSAPDVSAPDLPTSQNGWTIDPAQVEAFTTSGLTVRLRQGPASAVLLWVAAQYAQTVEPITMVGGYDNRLIRGSEDTMSNHASGTAIDFNWTRHTLGSTAGGTFTPAQVDAAHAIVQAAGGVVRWGGDYRGRVDSMHWEIVGTPEQTAALAARLPGGTAAIPVQPIAGPAAGCAPDTAAGLGAASATAAYTAGSGVGFVTRRGGQLLVDGQPQKFVGFNNNGMPHLGCGGGPTAHADVEAMFARFTGPNTVIRTWVFPGANLAELDYELAVAKRTGARLAITLSNSFGYCNDPGGEKGAGWYTGGWEATHGAWMRQVVGRYANESSVAWWELQNEPHGDRAAIKQFFIGASGLIKSIDAHHLVESGTFPPWAYGGVAGYTDLHNIPTLDMLSAHIYDPGMTPPGHLRDAEQAAEALGKPLYIGELGLNSGPGGWQDRAAQVRSQTAQAMAMPNVAGWAYWALNWSIDGEMNTGPADPYLPAVIKG